MESSPYFYLEYYLKNGKYHPLTPDFKKRGIRKASHKFALKGSSLVYIAKGRTQLVCRTDEEKKAAVQWCHENRLGSQLCNVKETLKLIQQRYYWHGMTKDFESKLYPCDVCTLQRERQGATATVINSISTVQREFNFNDYSNTEVTESFSFLKEEIDGYSDHIFGDEEDLESSEGDAVPPIKIIKRNASSDSLVNSSSIADNRSTHSDDWSYLQPHNSVSMVPIQTVNTETLKRRICDLETKNSALSSENDILKKKIKNLHRALENQKHVPSLRDLITQLKQSMPQTITTTITNFRE